MKNFFAKKCISLMMAILMILSTIGVANAEAHNALIKSIIFEDDNGNMVFVDYAAAIEQSIEGNNELYNAIKNYVGIAEEKGRPIYLERVNGEFLDYAKALSDNLSRLIDIIDNEKYKVDEKIKFTHELWIDDNGEAVITDPEEKSTELISITPVDGIEVEIGTSEDIVKERLPKTTTIKDSKDRTHTVDLDWNIENYNKDAIGEYKATGTFTLPKGVVNKQGKALEVEALVKVFKPIEEPDFPIEVDEVFIIESEITGNTYANINIKEEFVLLVESVNVDGKLANKMEENQAQWRIKVDAGTTVDDLKGKVSVSLIVNEGNVHVTLSKDGTSAGNGVDFALIKESFYIENKETGKKYRDGTSPSNADRIHQMKGIPEGKYTIHFDAPEGMYVDKIEIGEAYKETVYNPETNPLVVVDKGSKNFNYVKIQLRANSTLKEIKPVSDLRIPIDITIDDFKAALPKQTTIVDSNNQEHQVDLKWDIRPFNFDSWKKPGEYTIWSEFFKLPLLVSDTVPATRLEVKLKVIFEEEDILAPKIKAAEDSIKALPSFSDIRIEHKQAVLAAKQLVDEIKNLDPTKTVKGEELIQPMLDKIQYLEDELNARYFDPTMWMLIPEIAEVQKTSNVYFEGHVPTVEAKYVDKIFIGEHEADVEYVEYVVIKNVMGSIVYKGPAYKFFKTIELPDGTHTIKLKLISQSGRISEDPIGRTIRVDTTTP